MGWTFGDNVFYDTTIKQLLHNTLPYSQVRWTEQIYLQWTHCPPINVILEITQTLKKKVDPYVVVASDQTWDWQKCWVLTLYLDNGVSPRFFCIQKSCGSELRSRPIKRQLSLHC